MNIKISNKLLLIFCGLALFIGLIGSPVTGVPYVEASEEHVSAEEHHQPAAGHGVHGQTSDHGSTEKQHSADHSEHGNTAGHGSAEEHHTSSHGEHGHTAVQEKPLHSALPLWALLIPIIGALLVYFLNKNLIYVRAINIGATFLTFVTLLLMYSPVINGVSTSEGLLRGITYTINYMPGFDISFRVDPAGLLIALITSFIWLVTSIYSVGYMSQEKDEDKYTFFYLLTLFADLGVVLAGDFLTLFICFECLIFFPYFLFAHRRKAECITGANYYLYLGAGASLFLLAGMVLLGSYGGSIAIEPASQAVNMALGSRLRYIIVGLMIFGFGGKAGIFLEHIWMNKAYHVAPTPTAIVSSGGMIKAGAYGIFRVVCMLFAPVWDPTGPAAGWLTLHNVGYVVIWIGTISMFLAVLSALITEDSKKMLAFHSISQMGYIVMGIGVAAYLGSDGAMGLAGALYHIVNHSLFKSLLFMGVGAVYLQTKEVNMYKLGGLWRNMPVAAVLLLIGVCGISGIPGFNGFASKTLLHHAIVEAYEHSNDQWLKFAEIIFMLTAGGTFASNIKLFILTFLRKRPEKYKDVKPAPKSVQIPMIILAAVILFLGLFPNWLLNNFIGPALSYFYYDPGSHPYHVLYNLHAASPASIIPILYPVGHAVAGAWSEVLHNLTGGGTAVMLGAMYFILGFRFGWFHLHVPPKFEVEYYYKKAYYEIVWFCQHPLNEFGVMVNSVITWCMVYIWLPFNDSNTLEKATKPFEKIDKAVNDTLVYGSNTLEQATKPFEQIDDAVNRATTEGGALLTKLIQPLVHVDELVDGLVNKGMVDAWRPFYDPQGVGKVVEKDLTKFYDKMESWQHQQVDRYVKAGDIAKQFDEDVVDNIVVGTADRVEKTGESARIIQTGNIHIYAKIIAVSFLLLMTWFLFFR